MAVLARYVRLRPLSWHNKPVIRVQVLGQPAGLPMGLQSESISDDQLTASSSTRNGPAKCFRLNNHGTWRPAAEEVGQHLTVKLRAKSWLTGFATQGGEANDGDLAGWVTAFMVSVSEDGEDWKDLVADENSDSVEFVGNVSPSDIKTFIISEPQWVRYIRFKPLCWVGSIAMRAELYGMGVETPMGMEHGSIANSQVSASSAHFEGPATKGRLNGSAGAWVAGINDEHQHFQIDFKSRKTVVGVSVQGKSAESGQEAYVTSFCIQYSLDGENWLFVQTSGVDTYFSGNSNGSEIVTHLLPAPITTQFIRICPKSWHSTIALRVEVYGASRSTHIMEDDEAALEDSAAGMPMLLSTSARTTSAAGEEDQAAAGGNAADATSEEGARVANAPIFFAQLAPLWIVAKENQPKGSVKPIKPYQGMLVTQTEKTGNSSTINGRTGWLESICDNGQDAKVTFLDTSTGLSICERVSLESLRAHVQVYGQSFQSTREAKEYAVSVESALSIHYARRALLSFLEDWKKASEKTQEETEALSLAAIGGPLNLIKLLKLVAASEGSLSMHAAASGSDERSSHSSTSMPLTRGMRDILEFLLSKEAAKPEHPKDNVSSKGEEEEASLSQVLVEECVCHFVQSTKPADSRNVQVRESLHPYYKKKTYNIDGVVKFEGATALRIHFDPRCRTLPSAELKFALDPGFGRVIQKCSGGPSSFRPFLIHSDRFYFRFTSEGQQESDCWGYRFQVVPLLGLQWLCEHQVLTEASLEWACWLLDFLLAEAATSQHSAAPVLPQGAVHNNTVFGALVRYLRSGGVPYKHHVVALLTRLLHFSDLFSTRDPPNLGLLAGIVALVKERCQVAEANPSEAIALPIRLQALMELCVAARLAAQPSATTAKGAPQPQGEGEASEGAEEAKGGEEEPSAISLPPNPDDLPMVDVLVDVLETAKSLSEGSHLPEDMLCEAYLKGVGIRKVIDSEQLLADGGLEKLMGEVKFDGAKELHVRLVYDPPVEDAEEDFKAFSPDTGVIIEAVPAEECLELEKHGLEHGLDLYKPVEPSPAEAELDPAVVGVEETKGGRDPEGDGKAEEVEEEAEQNQQGSGQLPGVTTQMGPNLSVSIDNVPILKHSQVQESSEISPLPSPRTGAAVHPAGIPEEESGFQTPDYGRPREDASTGHGEDEVNQMIDIGISRDWATVALRRTGWSVERAVAFCFENDMDALVEEENQMDQNALRNWQGMAVATDMDLDGPDREFAELYHADRATDGMDTMHHGGRPINPLHQERRGGFSSVDMMAPEDGIPIATVVPEAPPIGEEGGAAAEVAGTEPVLEERGGGGLLGMLRRHDTMGDGWQENLVEANQEAPEATGLGREESQARAEDIGMDTDGVQASQIPVEEDTPPQDPEATRSEPESEGSVVEVTDFSEIPEAALEEQTPRPQPESTANELPSAEPEEPEIPSEDSVQARGEAQSVPEEGINTVDQTAPENEQSNVGDDSHPAEAPAPEAETLTEAEAPSPTTQLPTEQQETPPSDECQMMMAMGLERAMCEAALRRTNNNVQMAIELCFEGGMEEVMAEEARMAEAARAAEANANSSEAASITEPNAEAVENKQDQSKESTDEENKEQKESEKPAEEDSPEVKAQKEKQEAWQSKVSDISSELVLDEGVFLTLLLAGHGFLADAGSVETEYRASLGQTVDLTSLLSLSHPETSKHDNRFNLQNKESKRYLVALPDGNVCFRLVHHSQATAFLFETYREGLKLALKTPDGRYVKSMDGGFRAEPVLGTDFDTAGGTHLFDVIARTSTSLEEAPQSLPEPNRVTLKAPGRPLGLGSGAIEDSQITASSVSDDLGEYALAARGRLRRNDPSIRSGWYAAQQTNQYLQIDLKEKTLLTGISTQGAVHDSSESFVREYRLSVSEDGVTWAILQERGVTLLFSGNIRANQIISHRLKTPIACRYVRVCPTKYYNQIALRLELHGVHRYKIPGGLPADSHHLSEPIVIPGDSLQFAFKPPPQGHSEPGWPNGKGIKFVVTAIEMGNKEKEAWLKSNLSGFQEAKDHMQHWTPQVDEELSVWVTQRAERIESSRASTTLLDLAPRDVVLTPREQLQLQLIASRPAAALHVRFSLLQQFNRRLRRVLPCVDLNTTTPWRIGSQLRNAGHCVFHDLKMALLEDALQKTAGGANSINLLLDHQKKMLSHDREEKDPATSQCIFVQAFQQIHDQPVEVLRLSEAGGRVFRVQFEGEAGIDAGGVYREAVTEMVEDLHSSDFNLMVLCPNGQHKINLNMDKYIPSPENKSPLAIQMLEFVGKLMGISLRTKATLPFNFPALVWKGVLGHKLTLMDLEGVDSMAVEFIQALKGEEDKMTKEEFEATYGDVVNFTTTGSTGETVELIPNGAQIPVTYYNRLEYCAKVERYRLHELDAQFAAIRRGLGCIVPLSILQLFTWQQVEVLIAGQHDIDVEYLKDHTEYKGFPAESDVVKWFWAAMESFSSNERSQFIRFVWGRSRLPNRGRTWPQPFKFQRMPGGNDQTLPVTHTCFFSIEMPPYSSEEIMRKRLLTAINFGVGGILNG